MKIAITKDRHGVNIHFLESSDVSIRLNHHEYKLLSEHINLGFLKELIETYHETYGHCPAFILAKAEHLEGSQ